MNPATPTAYSEQNFNNTLSICRQFRRSGSCANPACIYVHPYRVHQGEPHGGLMGALPPPPPMWKYMVEIDGEIISHEEAVAKKPKGYCFMYLEDGICTFGETCRFRHPPLFLSATNPRGELNADNQQPVLSNSPPAALHKAYYYQPPTGKLPLILF